MFSFCNKIPSNVVDPAYLPAYRIKLLTLIFIASGVIVTLIWLCLFVAGLLIDSSYYRAAISYNFASFNDWLLTIVSFTFSNVILLAFMSGLLGGITSKVRATSCFTVSIVELAGIKEKSKTQIENPFISAFRGMFVFVAILAMQYVSSFNDLGSISNISEQAQKDTELKYEMLFSRISEKIKDAATLDTLRSEIKKQVMNINSSGSDTSNVRKILEARIRLREFKISDSLSVEDKKEKKELELKIGSIRRLLKVPSNVDFAEIGVSSFSYFKFAVIVSFLAFIFGYDSTKFAEFLEKIFKDQPNKNSNTDNPQLADKLNAKKSKKTK